MSDDLVSILIVAVVVLVIAVAVLGVNLHDANGRWRTSRQIVRDLATLDPTLLDVFGYDTYDASYRDVRRIDAARVSRLAETRRTLSQRAAHSTELDEALAALAEARKDEA